MTLEKVQSGIVCQVLVRRWPAAIGICYLIFNLLAMEYQRFKAATGIFFFLITRFAPSPSEKQ
jgi:hypothetical protein